MIRLPLDQYSYKGSPTRPDICAEVHEEGALVRLTVELEPGELTPHVRPAAPPTFDMEAWRQSVAEGDVADALRERIKALTQELDAMSAQAELFKQALDRVRQAPEVWRDLLPQEARELAAMLRHYADEAERR